MKDKIGFIQGRLSPMIDGKIQAFPWEHWQEEFLQAEECGLHLMEWTLDQERLYDNPIMTKPGQKSIRQLCRDHGVSIPSLTGDCFMQAPFWKEAGSKRKLLEQDFLAVAEGSALVGVSMLVVPLVDNGRLENLDQEDILVGFLESKAGFFAECGLQVIFEADFEPRHLARFIGRLQSDVFGINYDIGNSAALGFVAEEEFFAYGHRIVNVHVKDRLLGGTTVPLGTGDANFEKVFALLARLKYSGNYILQTARADNDQHASVLSGYRDMVMALMRVYGS